jgi:hypothetical protein
MIMQALKSRIRRWICPECDSEHDLQTEGERRLQRAEHLHCLSTDAISAEARKQEARVSDMRIVANAAVARLRHERQELQEANRR